MRLNVTIPAISPLLVYTPQPLWEVQDTASEAVAGSNVGVLEMRGL